MLVLPLMMLAVLGGSKPDTRHTVLWESEEPFLATLWQSDRTTASVSMTTADGQLLAFSQWECRPCSELYDFPLALLCCRQTRYFFKPASRSWRHCLMAFLLLIGGVERNQGPTSLMKTNL